MPDTSRWRSAAGAGLMALGALVGLSLVSGGSVGDGSGVPAPRQERTTVDEAEHDGPSPVGRSARTVPDAYGGTGVIRPAKTTRR
ncbi:hypothetical protein [Streptomyces sp. NPDC005955]|jgi:hypothetical protein|uniref:hypothetical protein n=1 Tax=Streptomyces sp. NPDC005955 TaxID=3364738 RepID=UPI0036CD247C